ncbi:MAG: hypothetical protein HC866_06920 [Leptolyngbyaceae cyanobacterium RU_5_1]|nr:hypothetical protein [Leptolyngbyaceae cyanobacterium RU_5_1]
MPTPRLMAPLWQALTTPPPNGTLTFAPGVTSQTVTVDVRGDGFVENNETLFLNLTSPTNALLSNAQATGTILNDDVPPGSGSISRVSVASNGTQADNFSAFPAISTDGRYVVFTSNASNLVTGDTNNLADSFVRDRLTNQTTLVSSATTGLPGNGISTLPAISADGRFVAFSSDANNLVSGDSNNATDIFIHDRTNTQTTRISVASDGTQADGSSQGTVSLSADGRYVVFSSSASNLVAGDTNSTTDIFLRDRLTDQTTRLNVASDGTQSNGASSNPTISADGRYVVFTSNASNLVAGDTNNQTDIFVRDRQTGDTRRVSVAADGTQANNASSVASVSGNGRYAVFTSQASNLVAGDTNNAADVFVHDLVSGETSRVSVGTDGIQANGSFGAISNDGRYVAFQSSAVTLTGITAANPLAVFIHDRQTGITRRASIATDGTLTSGGGDFAIALSGDGSVVAFTSAATNLVSTDTNGVADIFVYQRSAGLGPSIE